MLVCRKKKYRSNKKRNLRRRSKLGYQTLERRQLLAVTASLNPAGTELTLTGDGAADELEVSVNAAGELQWTQDGPLNFTNDLNSATTGVSETYVMGSSPLNVIIDLGLGDDRLILDLAAYAGLQNVSVMDGGDADIDSVAIVSDLDLLLADGELDIQAEETVVSHSVLVAAPAGISVSGTGQDALIQIGSNAILSTRKVLPGGDHQLDASVADSSPITLTSKTINVADDASLFAHVEPGSPFTGNAISMDAVEALPTAAEFNDLLNDISTGSVPWSDANELFNQTCTATIDIGSADLRASSISLNANANTETEIPSLGDIVDAVTAGSGLATSLQLTSDYLSGQLTDFLASTDSFAAWRVKEVTTAVVRIGDDANLEADTDVVISATTRSKDSSKVADETQAIAVIGIESTSAVTLGEGAHLVAGNDVTIATDATIEATAEARTAKDLGATTATDDSPIAVAITETNLNSNIRVAKTALIHSGGDLNLHANGQQSVSSDAGAGFDPDEGVGVSAAFSFPKSNVTTDLFGSLLSDAGPDGVGIVIRAELETDELAVALSGLGGADAPDPVASLPVDVQAFLDFHISPLMDSLLSNQVGSPVSPNIDAAPATAVIESDNHVAATVHGDAVVGSLRDLDVGSSLTAKVRTFAESVFVQDPTTKPNGDVESVAVTVGIFENQTSATIEEGAIVDASRDLNLQATSQYPFNPPLVLVEDGGTRTIEVAGNSWARSHSSDGFTDIAGAMTYQDYSNVTTATIGDDVLVNQSTPFSTSDQSVHVTANSDLYTLDIAGLFELVIDVTAITDTEAFQQAFISGGLPALIKAVGDAAVTSWNDSDIDYGAGSEKTGVGGSAADVNIENETTASIGDGVFLNTGDDGELLVDADSRVLQYSFSMSGIESGDVGLAGSLTQNFHDNHTTAKVGMETHIVAGSISVTSDSDLWVMGFAGGVLHAGNYGFGVSTATNDVNRQTNAYIGSVASGGGGSITTAGDLLLEANNHGGVYGFALSGAIQSEELASTAASQNTNSLWAVPSSFSSAGNQGSYGIGFSGDAAVNHVTNDANAFISENSVIGAHKVTVHATDETSVVAAAGSAALTSKHRSVGLAGSFAQNSVNGSALAWIRDAQVITGTGGLKVVGERGAASGVWAGTASAAVSKGDLAAAVNVSLNYSNWRTRANLYDATILAGRDALLMAKDDSKTVSIAAAAALQGKVGFGSAFTLNSMEGTTTSGIHNSTVEAQRALALTSNTDALIVSATGSLGSGKNFGFAGTVAVNHLSSVVESSISDSTVVAGARVTVHATDDSSILSISGAVVAYDGSGFGGAFALNQVNQNVDATISGSEVTADRGTSVRSTGSGEINAFGVGVAGQEAWGAAGSMAINRLATTVDATVNESIVDATTGIVVFAESKGEVGSFTGGFAGAATTAVGASLSLNEIDASVASYVVESTLATTTGPVRISGVANGRLQSLAAGGAGAENFGLGGSVATNESLTNVEVQVRSSTIDSAKDFEVSAENQNLISALSGGGAGASGDAVGAGVSLNQIHSSMNAGVIDSDVTSGNSISVTADNDSEIKSLAIGGAGATDFALGGGVATNEIQSTIAVRIADSAIDATTSVKVSAEDGTEVNALSGGVAGAGGAGTGAGVSLNEIRSSSSVSVHESQIASGRDVAVTVDNEANINALAVGGVGAASFALGGGVATNEIHSDMDVNIAGSTIDATRNVEVSAENISEIQALSGGAAVSSGSAVGAGLSLNEIESNIRACIFDSHVTSGGDVSVTTSNVSTIEAMAIGGAGAGTFALGASVSVNRIGGVVSSCMMGQSDVIAAGDLSVTTSDASQIHAVAPGLAGGGVVAVGISVVDNDIDRTLKAIIEDSTINAGADVIVEVSSQSGHHAIAVGGAVAGDVAVAGSSGSNRITKTTEAAVDGESLVAAGGDVVIRSSVTQSLNTNVIQAAGSLGFSIAGAIATNHVDSVTTARVGEGVSVASQGNVSILSNDNTEVNSSAGELAVGVYVAGTGASVSTVQVHKDVQAFIDKHADVYAAAAHPRSILAYSGDHDANGDFLHEEIRGVAVQATSSESVNNVALGVDAGLYAGVAATVTATIVQPHVEAWIGEGAIVDADSAGTPSPNGEKTPTNVNVSAVNHSMIRDSATGIGVGAVGMSGAVDIGRIHHFVWGHIDNDAEVKALYDIDVHGLSKKLVDSDTIAAGAGAVGLSGSVSVWNIGAPFNSEYMLNGTKMKALQTGGTTVDQYGSSVVDFVDGRLDKHFGKGSQGKKDLYSDLHAKDRPTGVIATIKQNAALTAGDDIDVRAREWLLTDASTGAAEIGGYAGVGAAVAIMNVHSDTDAGVFGHLNAGDDTFVQATMNEATDCKSLSGEIGALAAGAAIGVVNDSSEQSARVAYGGWIESTDRLVVEAGETLRVDVITGQANLGFLSMAASVSEIHNAGLTEAYLDEATIGTQLPDGSSDTCDPGLSQVRMALVRTDVNHDLSTNVGGIASGAVAVGVTVSAVDDQHQMQSWVGGGSTVVLRETLGVLGGATLNAETALTTMTTGLVGVSVPRSAAALKPVDKIYVEDATVCVGNDLVVRGDSDTRAMAQGLAFGVSGIGVQAIDIDAFAVPEIQTWVEGRETRVHAGRNVVVESLVIQDAEVDAAKGVAAGVDVGSLEARADSSGSVSTRVGKSATLNIGNDLTIRSDTVGESTVNVLSPSVAGVTIGDNDGFAVASFDAEARLGSVRSLWVTGDTLIESTTDRNAETDVVAVGIAGAVGATSNVQSVAGGSNTAAVTGRVNSTTDLTVAAFEKNRTVADADSFSASLVTGTGLRSRTIANPLVGASISSEVDALGNIDVAAGADLTTLATGTTIGVNLVTFGDAMIVADLEPTVIAQLRDGAELTSDGDVSVTANHTLGPDTAGQPVVTGTAATLGVLGGGTGMTLNGDSSPRVDAVVDDGAAVLEAADLVLESRSETNLNVFDETVSVTGVVGVGGTHGNIRSGGNVKSQLGGTIGKVNDVELSAIDLSYVDVTSQATMVAGGASVPSGKAVAIVDPRVQTLLRTNLNADGDVVMVSETQADANADVELNSVAVLAAAGETEAFSSIAPVMETAVDLGARVYADGSIQMEARHNVDEAGNLLPKGASASAESANVALGASVADSIATALSIPEVSTRADQGAVLHALQNVSLRSQSYSDAVADSDATQIGAVGAGVVTAIAESGGSVESVLDDVEYAFTRSGDIEVLASTRNDSTATAVGTATGIVGSGNATQADAKSIPDVSARAGALNGIEAGRNARVIALGSGEVLADAEGYSKSVLFNQGAVEANGTYAPTVESLVLPNTDLTAGNDVEILAYGNTVDATGTYDTARAVVVNSVSHGVALLTGRSAVSNSTVGSIVTAFLGDDSSVHAGQDVNINARSYTRVETDADAKLTGLIGQECIARGVNMIDVSTLSGSPDVISVTGFSLSANNDIHMVSDTDLTSNVDANAVVWAFGGATASAMNDDVIVNTGVLLGNGSSATAGDDLFLHANKDLLQVTNASVGGIALSGAFASASCSPMTWVIFSGATIGGSTITIQTADPVISKVRSTVFDENASDADWDLAVKQGRIGGQASVSADVLILSAIGKGVIVNAEKVKIISELKKLDLSAEAEIKTHRKHNIEADESEQLKLQIHTQLTDDAEINRQSHSNQEHAVGYRAEIKKNKKGKVTKKERFREFRGPRERGKATAASTGFETSRNKRTKDVDTLDWFFGVLGRDVNGYS